ncbi:MAG: phytanoyl-CoA dioxygenase [Gemmatimonadetes bacterium]|nr:phytanoyl-CoA dioxygenase [Gemmatimonadota bacterium]MBT6146603.1 phytanoyl-CoA dioxygenase [Gemmatimonadota bacterium]MBT7863239.1 phytanoyl-CoA dioxygenase [Gemmatimonadota bacterium]
MIDPQYLLTDEQMRDFIVDGYVVLRSSLPASFHQQIYDRTLQVFEDEGNPGNNILPRVPQLRHVFDDPSVRGALTSVLGPDYIMHSHRHCHINQGKSEGGGIHKDSYWGYRKTRSHRNRWAMIFYYPQDCPAQIGPTGVVDGTHTYESKAAWEPIRDPHPLTGDAGTLVLVHFDLWHRAFPNLTDKTRFMMKFQFTRMADPVAPSWNHQSAEFPGGNGAGVRHRNLWTQVWDWHRGAKTTPVADGQLAEAVARLGDEDPQQRVWAADAIGTHGPAGLAHVDALVSALHDDYEPVRLNAAYALGLIGGKALDALTDSLDEEEEGCALAAGYGLTAAGIKALPHLAQACGAQTAQARTLAAFASGELGALVNPATAGAVADLVTDDEVATRCNTAEALGTMTAHSGVAVPALTKLLADDDGQTRFNAAYSLARHGAQAAPALDALVTALDDENRYVRNHSAQALQRIGTPAAMGALYDFLNVARWCPITSKDSTF